MIRHNTENLLRLLIALGIGFLFIAPPIECQSAAQETNRLNNPTRTLGSGSQAPSSRFQNYHGYYDEPSQTDRSRYGRRRYHRRRPNWPYDSFRYNYGYYGNYGYPARGAPYWYYAPYTYGTYPYWFYF